MRSLSPEAANLLLNADKLGLVESDMVVFTLTDGTEHAFWTEHDNEQGNVVNPFTGNPSNYLFQGAGTIVDVGETVRTSDLSIRRKTITLSGVHPAVLLMWLNHDTRMAKVAVYQAIYEPSTREMVSPLLEFVGELNGAPKEVASAGGDAAFRFDCVSDSRQLTRFNSAKRSPSHQSTREGDGFHKYIGVAGTWTIPFGQ